MPHQGPKGDLWGAYAAYVMMVLVNFFVVLSKGSQGNFGKPNIVVSKLIHQNEIYITSKSIKNRIFDVNYTLAWWQAKSCAGSDLY